MENREIKLRLWNPERRVLTAGTELGLLLATTDAEFMKEFNRCGMVWMQYTGLKDRNGEEIYEGDILQLFWVQENYQTHRGDNIPTGSYTEPDVTTLKKENFVVEFSDGSFILGGEYEYPGYEPNLSHYTNFYWMFQAHNMEDFSDSYFDDEGYPTMDSLKKELGLKVIGNIHQNPDLLK